MEARGGGEGRVQKSRNERWTAGSLIFFQLVATIFTDYKREKKLLKI